MTLVFHPTGSYWEDFHKVHNNNNNHQFASKRIDTRYDVGCVIALLTGFLSKHKLAGVIGCSGWIGVLSIMEKVGSSSG